MPITPVIAVGRGAPDEQVTSGVDTAARPGAEFACESVDERALGDAAEIDAHPGRQLNLSPSRDRCGRFPSLVSQPRAGVRQVARRGVVRTCSMLRSYPIVSRARRIDGSNRPPVRRTASLAVWSRLRTSSSTRTAAPPAAFRRQSWLSGRNRLNWDSHFWARQRPSSVARVTSRSGTPTPVSRLVVLIAGNTPTLPRPPSARPRAHVRRRGLWLRRHNANDRLGRVAVEPCDWNLGYHPVGRGELARQRWLFRANELELVFPRLR